MEVQSIFLWFGLHHLPVPHEGPQWLRNDDGAVLCLVLFTDCYDHPGYSTASSVDSVTKLSPAVPDIEPPGLVVSAVTAGTDLPPTLPAWQPGLDIKLLTGGAA